MKRIYTSNYVYKYRAGKWVWDADNEKIVYIPHHDTTMIKDDYIKTKNFKFLKTFDQLDEVIYLQEFQRPETSFDSDVILVQDIKNLILYLSPPEIMTKKFIRFVHTTTVHSFLNSLIIYFEYYLKMVEFILIRRDEISGEQAQMQSEDSVQIKRIYSNQLSQYRLLLAREYSIILLGECDMEPYYHITPIVNISQTITDKSFHEGFLAFCTQMVWVAMHRRAYDVIDAEMCRLFRSEHFKLQRSEITFTRAEASMLYGKNYRRVNYRAQNSPLIQELDNVSDEDLPILWIGDRKYRGTDLRIHQLELEYIVPDAQLSLIDVAHGILGHPKKIYNTMLKLDWQEVRNCNFSEAYDPYHIIRQPCLEVPPLDAEKIRKNCEKYESYYRLVNYYQPLRKDRLMKWVERDRIVNYFKTEGVITDIWLRCVSEMEDTAYGPSVKEIIENFIEKKKKLRKK